MQDTRLTWQEQPSTGFGTAKIQHKPQPVNQAVRKESLPPYPEKSHFQLLQRQAVWRQPAIGIEKSAEDIFP